MPFDPSLIRRESDPMPPDVRVHVRLGSIRLAFEGDQSFDEKHVESLVESAARGGVAGPRPRPAATDGPLLAAAPAAGAPPAAPARDAAAAAPGRPPP